MHDFKVPTIFDYSKTLIYIHPKALNQRKFGFFILS